MEMERIARISMNRPENSLITLLGCSLLLSLLYCPLFDPLTNDVEVFRYMGLAMSKGFVPYRDFFDHKPPLIYFLNYASLLLGGAWALWAINAALCLFSSWLFYGRCSGHRLPYPWLLPLLFNLMLRDRLICLGGGGTREYTAILFLLFFCVLMGRSRFKDALLGLLGGLIFFMQQEEVLPLAPFVVYRLLSKEGGPFAARVMAMVAGFLAIALPIVLYFGWNHSLAYFWQDAFLFNFTWYLKEEKTLVNHFSTVKRVLDNGNYEMAFMIAVVWGVLSLFFDHRKKGLLTAALAAVVLTLVPEFLGGRHAGTEELMDFYYYFLPLSASIPVLLFVAWAYSGDGLLEGRKFRLFCAILLCSSLGFTIVQHVSHIPRRSRGPIIDSPESNYLRAHAPGDFQVFVLVDNDYIYIYNELGIVAPSPWIYQHFWSWYDHWDADQRILRSIGDDLLRHRTTYIIFDEKRPGFFRRASDANWLMSFMNTHYERVAMPGQQDSQLWKLKD